MGIFSRRTKDRATPRKEAPPDPVMMAEASAVERQTAEQQLQNFVHDHLIPIINAMLYMSRVQQSEVRQYSVIGSRRSVSVSEFSQMTGALNVYPLLRSHYRPLGYFVYVDVTVTKGHHPANMSTIHERFTDPDEVMGFLLSPRGRGGNASVVIEPKA